MRTKGKIFPTVHTITQVIPIQLPDLTIKDYSFNEFNKCMHCVIIHILVKLVFPIMVCKNVKKKIKILSD